MFAFLKMFFALGEINEWLISGKFISSCEMCNIIGGENDQVNLCKMTLVNDLLLQYSFHAPQYSFNVAAFICPWVQGYERFLRTIIEGWFINLLLEN